MSQRTWIPIMTQDSNLVKPWYVPETGDQEQMITVWLTSLLEGFSPISLKEMDSVALLNRTDTKFVVPVGSLHRSLETLSSWYRILVVNGTRINRYRSLYFDTPGFDLYNLQVNGRAERYKVRTREYLDSRISYLEVKYKNRKDRTIKSRILTEEPDICTSGESREWLTRVFPYDSRNLVPKIWNTFQRITLVSKSQIERVTLDVDICFFANHRTIHLEGLAVAEVKLNASHRDSRFIELMRELKISSQGFSKYCIGTSLCYENVKKNSLKSKILWIEKNTSGVSDE